MAIPILRTSAPRLFHPADDPEFRFDPPRDPVRKRILKNLIADCEAYAIQKPWKRIPERPDSPHPYHQLYITFYSGMHATALIEHYAFTWRITGDERWLKRARAWLLAAAQWEHSDRIEEHFYTANRYMHAFAIALDLMSGVLSPNEERLVTDSLLGLMRRWWPDVEKNRLAPEGGHHAVVDNGHFGVAALHLLGRHPEAGAWVEAVIDRFRRAIMPHGCGKDGEPVDGPSFWAWENLWMLHFADALRNVTGIDLYREFPQRARKPLIWLRYQLDATLTDANHLHAVSPVLLRLAQGAGDADLRDIALRDSRLGGLYSFQAGVKGSPAECILAAGPSAYCYFDPGLKLSRRAISLPPSRKFTRARYGESGILREGWDRGALVECLSGYRGGAAHGFSSLHLQRGGIPLLKTISCEEAQPVSCGSLPCVGGQNEVTALLGKLEGGRRFDRLSVRSARLDQEYWLLRGETPALIVALRRRRRGVKIVRKGDVAFVRLDSRDYLQYPRPAHFSPDAGQIRMLVRLKEAVDPTRTQILFGTGFHGTRVNTFALGFLEGKGLTFAVRSQRANQVTVAIPPEIAEITPGRWHEIGATWGGFDDPRAKPFIEVELDGIRRRCDDPTRFGELGRDSQNLKSRTTPRTFYIGSNTVLAFGAGVQTPNTGIRCDIGRIQLTCPKRAPLELTFEDGLGDETGDGPLVWKLNPVDLREVKRTRARFGKAPHAVDLLPAFPDRISLARETVPYAPSGLAAGSLKWLGSDAGKPATRILATTDEDCLVLVLADAAAKARIEPVKDGFRILGARMRYAFQVHPRGRHIASFEAHRSVQNE